MDAVEAGGLISIFSIFVMMVAEHSLLGPLVPGPTTLVIFGSVFAETHSAITLGGLGAAAVGILVGESVLFWIARRKYGFIPNRLIKQIKRGSLVVLDPNQSRGKQLQLALLYQVNGIMRHLLPVTAGMEGTIRLSEWIRRYSAVGSIAQLTIMFGGGFALESAGIERAQTIFIISVLGWLSYLPLFGPMFLLRFLRGGRVVILPDPNQGQEGATGCENSRDDEG